MLKNTLQQTLTQKLSPLQIQLMNMLALPVLSFEQYVNAEIEANPALEASYTSTEDDTDEISSTIDDYDDATSSRDDDMRDYLYGDDEVEDYYSDNTHGHSAFISSRSVGDSYTENL